MTPQDTPNTLSEHRHTVVGVFDNVSDAERAIDDLRNAGFGNDSISVVTRERTAQEDFNADLGKDNNRAGEGALAGSLGGGTLGAVLGWLLAGGTALIPGIGPIAAAGIFGATVGGALIGGTVGGIAGALAGQGVPENEANEYEEHVKGGRTLVTVSGADDSTLMRARDIFDRNNAYGTRYYHPDQVAPGRTFDTAAGVNYGGTAYDATGSTAGTFTGSDTNAGAGVTYDSTAAAGVNPNTTDYNTGNSPDLASSRSSTGYDSGTSYNRMESSRAASDFDNSTRNVDVNSSSNADWNNNQSNASSTPVSDESRRYDTGTDYDGDNSYAPNTGTTYNRDTTYADRSDNPDKELHAEGGDSDLERDSLYGVSGQARPNNDTYGEDNPYNNPAYNEGESSFQSSSSYGSSDDPEQKRGNKIVRDYQHGDYDLEGNKGMVDETDPRS